MHPRPYQAAAKNAAIQWFCDGKDKPLVVLPTGTGKSVVCADLCRDIVQDAPHARVVVATHVKELVRQNYEKMLSLWSSAPVGIYSAGLNRFDRHAQILFCGIQSIYNRAVKIGHADLLIIDEAHTLPRNKQGMWDTFLRDLAVVNPKIRMLGLTATPFRLDTGNLIGGGSPQFNGICYEYSVVDAIKDGYLSEIVSAPVVTHLRTDCVKKRGGEYIPSMLERAVNTDELTAACCEEIIALGRDRKKWLIFASGNTHAWRIHEYLRAQKIDGFVLTKDTKRKDRDTMIHCFLNGSAKYIVNNMILTTGFDCPHLDLIACMRPTQSAGLWVQMCGRGMRMAPGKENCLLLDFGRNLDRHGPIDQISGSDWFEKEKGEAPIKNCPECFALCHASVRVCPDCGAEFPQNEPNITRKASNGSVFSFQKPEPMELQVIDMKVSRHVSRNNKPDTLRVSYTTLSGRVDEFICYDHPKGSFPFNKATHWGGWCDSVEEALQKEWAQPRAIVAVKEGKYWQVLQRLQN